MYQNKIHIVIYDVLFPWERNVFGKSVNKPLQHKRVLGKDPTLIIFGYSNLLIRQEGAKWMVAL